MKQPPVFHSNSSALHLAEHTYIHRITKYERPRTATDMIDRRQVVCKLNKIATVPCIVVTAPAGYGKTTTVSKWVAESVPVRKHAWLTLDAFDNEPSSFWRSVVLACKRVEWMKSEKVLQLLSDPIKPSMVSIVRMLLAEWEMLCEQATLVLDELEEVNHPEIMQSLRYLIDYLPGHVQLILLTREKGSLPLAKLELQERAASLEASDFRLTAEELDALMRNKGLPTMNEDEKNQVLVYFDGWIAGLKLAIAQMAQTNHKLTESCDKLTAYIEEEIWRSLSELHQHMLLFCVRQKSLPTAMLETVLGDDFNFFIRTMMSRGIVTVPNGNPGIYLLQPYIRDSMMKLVPCCGEDAGWYVRASQWYEDTGLHEESQQQFQYVRDPDLYVYKPVKSTMPDVNYSEPADKVDVIRTYICVRNKPHCLAEYAPIPEIDTEELAPVTTDASERCEHSIMNTEPDLLPVPVGLCPSLDTRLIDPLTRREQQILMLLATGVSNREIANEMHISIGTVKIHLNRIYAKLGVRSRVQALIQAKENGILDFRANHR
ncbi:helix-turn-helix transcriptional regulator [Marinicrinis sediminis]|uniref:LuxR C-terminal-related transcriptional regulator n=1 Tax=Marinicrinis sediminis TaxID=1652465 RepID=A0ABW5RA37_9BACL